MTAELIRCEKLASANTVLAHMVVDGVSVEYAVRMETDGPLELLVAAGHRSIFGDTRLNYSDFSFSLLRDAVVKFLKGEDIKYPVNLVREKGEWGE